MSEKEQINTTNEAIDASIEAIPSMEDFEDQIEKSFDKLNVGDIIEGTIVGVSDTEVRLDLGSYAEGIIRESEFSIDPSFSIKDSVLVGEKVSAEVISDDDGEGNIILSKKQADFVLAWDKLKKLFNDKIVVKVKINQSVKGGVITYLEGVRGFIPASQLSISYVDNLDEWVEKEVEALLITVDQVQNKLVLSSKQVELDKRKNEQADILNSLERGMVLDAVINNIVPYGAFVKINDNLSGLVHISQISKKFLNSPNEVVKVGDEVKVKILNIKDGKLNLSIKAVEEDDKPLSKESNTFAKGPKEFSSNEEASTSLGDILKNINLS